MSPSFSLALSLARLVWSSGIWSWTPLFRVQARDRERRRYPSRCPRGPPRSTDYLRTAHRNHQAAQFRGSRWRRRRRRRWNQRDHQGASTCSKDPWYRYRSNARVFIFFSRTTISTLDLPSRRRTSLTHFRHVRRLEWGLGTLRRGGPASLEIGPEYIATCLQRRSGKVWGERNGHFERHRRRDAQVAPGGWRTYLRRPTCVLPA